MVKATAVAFIAFTLFTLAHFAHFHFCKVHGKAKAVLMTSVIFFGSYVALYALTPEDQWWVDLFGLTPDAITRYVYPALGALCYWFLFLGYLEFYFTADRSITFRMLIIIDESPRKAMTDPEMQAAYDTPGIISRRLEDMTYGGYLQQSGKEFALTPKGVRTLKFYRFVIEFLRLRRY